MSMHQIKFCILKFFLLFDIYPFSPSTYLTVPMVQCSGLLTLSTIVEIVDWVVRSIIKKNYVYVFSF